MKQEDVTNLLEQHRQWLNNPVEGNRIYLQNKDLHGLDLSHTILAGSIFRDCNLQGVNLSFSDISGSIFDGSNMQSANLYAADALLSSFRDADMSDSDLSHVNFEEATLENSDLHDSLLKSTNFKRTKLSGTNLEGVLELDTAVMTVGTSLLSAKLDENTLKKMLYRLLEAFYASENISEELKEALDSPCLRVLAKSAIIGYNNCQFLLTPHWQERK